MKIRHTQASTGSPTICRLSQTTPRAPSASDELYRTRPVRGTSEVICYHPDHSKTFAELDSAQAAAVVRTWRDRYRAAAEHRVSTMF
ncbi:MAG: hypothetical protein R2748_31440 [Bryobacterales bacterium]